MEKEILDYDRLAGDVSIFDFLETDSEDLIKDRGIQPFHVVHNTPHYASPASPTQFCTSMVLNFPTEDCKYPRKIGNDDYAKFFLWRRGEGGLKRCIMGNVKMVSYHPSDHFFLTNRDLFWARQSHLGLQRLHHLS